MTADCTTHRTPHVVQFPKSTSIGNRTTNPLVSQTLENLTSFFREHTSHNPSEEMLCALADLTGALAGMAEGGLRRLVYLSSLDPGVGKTRTVCEFFRVLLQSQDHTGVAGLICLGRLEEVAGMVANLGLPKEHLGVLTSDDDINALGGSDPNACRILVTTQQMIDKRCDGRSFEAQPAFHYNGNPRQIRVWDESILPGRPLTLRRDQIALLLDPVRPVCPDLGDCLDQLVEQLRSAEDGESFPIDDLQTFGVTLEDLLQVIPEEAERARDALTTLWGMAGRRVSVRKTGKYGNTVLDYAETLPPDLAPLVVLDASGRVRGTYPTWRNWRGGLVYLRSAAKSYRNLTVRVWRRGGGKASFEAHADELQRGIATTIEKAPEEEWLVICHKPRPGRFDVERGVRALLDDSSRVHFLTWGQHQATNAYCHIKRVILAGTLFYGAAHYEALGRLAAAYPSDLGALPEGLLDTITLGEHLHQILQAVCRGAARQCAGEVCLPCEVYLIAGKQHGIEGALGSVFPGADIRPWRPLPYQLSGLVKITIGVLRDWMETTADEAIKFSEVCRRIGGCSAANFSNKVRKHPAFRSALVELGLEEYGTGRRRQGFRRLGGVFGPCD